MQTDETMTGIGVKVGVNDDFGALQSSIAALYNALGETSGAVTDVAEEVIGNVREVGVENLVRLAREGSEQAMQLLGLLYVVMQQVTTRGVPEAGELASTIAGQLEAAGYTIESSDCGCKH